MRADIEQADIAQAQEKSDLRTLLLVLGWGLLFWFGGVFAAAWIMTAAGCGTTAASAGPVAVTQETTVTTEGGVR